MADTYYRMFQKSGDKKDISRNFQYMSDCYAVFI
jgi:hypothetical protein